jgi:hypothetical protein
VSRSRACAVRKALGIEPAHPPLAALKAVRQSVGWVTRTPFREIKARLEELGVHATERTIFRALKRLEREGDVLAYREGPIDEWGYTLTKKGRR